IEQCASATVNLPTEDFRPRKLAGSMGPTSTSILGWMPVVNKSLFRPCRSYTELCASLHTCGFAPPPPDYFAPTPQERNEGAESILRQVMTRPRWHGAI